MEDIKTKQHIVVPKRVREYMIELASTFVAVALAFISQYYFQYRSDRSTEHDLMVSLVSDLKNDISNVEIRENTLKPLQEAGIELESLCYGDYHSLENQKLMYKDGLILKRYVYQMTVNEGTLNQLKNAGGMRLVRIPEIVTAINIYDTNARNDTTVLSNLSLRKDEYVLGYSKVFRLNSWHINSLIADYSIINKCYQKYGTDLLTEKPDDLAMFGNKVNNYTDWVTLYVNSFLLQRKLLAQKLVLLIQSRYHID